MTTLREVVFHFPGTSNGCLGVLKEPVNVQAFRATAEVTQMTTPHELVPVDTLTPGEVLELHRRRGGYSIPEAAEIFGVPPSRYRRWEIDGAGDSDVDDATRGPRLKLDTLTDHERCFIARRRAGMSLAQLCDATGLSKTWLSNAERGVIEDVRALLRWWELVDGIEGARDAVRSSSWNRKLKQ